MKAKYFFRKNKFFEDLKDYDVEITLYVIGEKDCGFVSLPIPDGGVTIHPEDKIISVRSNTVVRFGDNKFKTFDRSRHKEVRDIMTQRGIIKKKGE